MLRYPIWDLEQRLELEQTARQRMETQIDRLKESVKKMDKEADEISWIPTLPQQATLL